MPLGLLVLLFSPLVAAKMLKIQKPLERRLRVTKALLVIDLTSANEL